MKCILLRQSAHVFNGHCVTNISQFDSMNRNRKKTTTKKQKKTR